MNCSVVLTIKQGSSWPTKENTMPTISESLILTQNFACSYSMNLNKCMKLWVHQQTNCPLAPSSPLLPGTPGAP